jgi:hypothetical protein
MARALRMGPNRRRCDRSAHLRAWPGIRIGKRAESVPAVPFACRPPIRDRGKRGLSPLTPSWVGSRSTLARRGKTVAPTTSRPPPGSCRFHRPGVRVYPDGHRPAVLPSTGAGTVQRCRPRDHGVGYPPSTAGHRRTRPGRPSRPPQPTMSLRSPPRSDGWSPSVGMGGRLRRNPQRPTVDTKYPRAQKCCPTKLRLRSPYTRAR